MSFLTYIISWALFTVRCLCSVIAKGFRSADSEESGVVDKSAVPGLAGKVIGASIKETDLDIIRFKAETKAGSECNPSSIARVARL